MSTPRALRLSRAPAAALASVGALWGGLSGLMPDIKAGVAASDAAFGAVLLMSALGAMLSMLAAPWAIRRMGRRALPGAGVALCLTFFFPLMANDILGLAVAMMGVGIVVSMLDMTENLRVSALEARNGLDLMKVNSARVLFYFGGAA